ncbi:transcription factor cwo isoform X2 [Tribolium madens]|uniref:transcription factor cwo isoform X2 n=1 Tax=Tribolium madens TaxID=41895 RepID=UPI001CF75B59|nr:transcription factor cwo isoform X2 [Tribolium madens]
MDMTQAYWEENSANIQRVKYEGCNSNDELGRSKDERGVYQCCETNLNFSTATCSEDDSEYGPYKKNKVTRQDPMSHRIIEKRRRDRMNNCLADLSRLIPTEYLKKGRGRIEKTEIIEMAIKHMNYLQQEHGSPSEHYRMGYQECMSEAMRFMVEVEGHFPREGICVRILNHLQKHCESLSRMTQPSAAANQPILETRNLQEVGNPQVQVSDYQTPKTEPNNNGSFTVSLNDTENYDKHPECNGNGVSYKYKNNIKMRFSQDLNEGIKRQKTENGRRASVNSVENQSRSSPPSSELLTRISEHEPSRISPTESTSSLNHMKIEPIPRNELRPYSPRTSLDKNFNVPIFVLHAKGSYYVPLTIDYKTLLPFLRNYDILEVVPGMHNVVLHPVTINVNFQPNYVNGKYNWN